MSWLGVGHVASIDLWQYKVEVHCLVLFVWATLSCMVTLHLTLFLSFVYSILDINSFIMVSLWIVHSGVIVWENTGSCRFLHTRISTARLWSSVIIIIILKARQIYTWQWRIQNLTLGGGRGLCERSPPLDLLVHENENKHFSLRKCSKKGIIWLSFEGFNWFCLSRVSGCYSFKLFKQCNLC